MMNKIKLVGSFLENSDMPEHPNLIAILHNEVYGYYFRVSAPDNLNFCFDEVILRGGEGPECDYDCEYISRNATPEYIDELFAWMLANRNMNKLNTTYAWKMERKFCEETGKVFPG